MKYKTHISFGLLLYFLLIHLNYFKLSIYGLIMVFIGTLLPDIDKHTSFLGKKIKLVSFSAELILSHRGIIHSIWLAILCLFISFELFLGYISHLFLDMLNPKGVKLFWPWCRIKGKIKSGRILEFFLFILIFLTLIYSVLLLFYNY